MADFTPKSATVKLGAYADPRAAPLLDTGTGPANPGRHARWPALAVRPAAAARRAKALDLQWLDTAVLRSPGILTWDTYLVLVPDTLGDIREVP